MPTNVVMPQLGESVAEGTVVRWIKRVGDSVGRDEPLFEISTDKVDAEIPSPVAGVLTEIRVKEGETVPVESVVAIIDVAGSVPRPEAPRARVAAAPVAAVPVPGSSAREAEPPADPETSPEPVLDLSHEEQRDKVRRARSSPLVRRIAAEHQIDISTVVGSGVGGRVTKRDILQHVDGRSAAAPHAGPHAPPAVAPTDLAVPTVPSDRVEIVPMTVMRKKIAEHMIFSQQTSAHVHSVFEFDFHRVAQIREQKRAEFERAGVKPTYMAFIAKAICDALRALPVLNTSIEGDNVVYRKDINLGIAVALDWGLIVPVVRNADEKNVVGLSRAIADLAARARAKQLKADEVQGGTFTITNPGTFGTLFGMPIINQPQVAILGVGAIEKRVVVIGDAIHVRPRGYMTLGYDHRLVDGALADQFMSHVKRTIEDFDPSMA
ncbi:MAG: dihydrolipoamide acetyltransferase family protein [Vicinamibacterales bacterium]